APGSRAGSYQAADMKRQLRDASAGKPKLVTLGSRGPRRGERAAEVHAEGRALPGSAFDVDSEAVLVGNAFHDGEADARAVRASREERVEQARSRVVVDADAAIDDRQHGGLAFHLEHDAHGATGAARLYPVANEIPDELPELRAVRLDD